MSHQHACVSQDQRVLMKMEEPGNNGEVRNNLQPETTRALRIILARAATGKPMSDVPVQDPVSLSLGSGLRGPTNRREGVPTVSA